MNEQDFRIRFPNASHDCLRANVGPSMGVDEALPSKPKPKRKRTEMNQTERQFHLMLALKYREASVLFHCLKLRIADDCWYTPDFAVLPERLVRHPGVPSIYFYEVKGSKIWGGAKERFKAVREKYPHFDFEMWQKTKQGWKHIL